MVFLLEQYVQSPVSVARFLSGQRDHLFPQFGIVVRSRLIAVCASIHSKELAGTAFAHFELLANERHILP
jgi:hypothetical protein